MITQAKETKEKVVYNLRKDMAQFGINELELDERITVLYDEHHFNPKEDESVWLQKKGKAPRSVRFTSMTFGAATFTKKTPIQNLFSSS